MTQKLHVYIRYEISNCFYYKKKNGFVASLVFWNYYFILFTYNIICYTHAVSISVEFQKSFFRVRMGIVWFNLAVINTRLTFSLIIAGSRYSTVNISSHSEIRLTRRLSGQIIIIFIIIYRLFRKICEPSSVTITIDFLAVRMYSLYIYHSHKRKWLFI